jgi:hypothetical protein
MTEQRKDWDCEAYGPDLPADLGNLCFYDLVERCTDEAQCHLRMVGTRQQMFRRINELAAAGDPDFEYLAEEFSRPSQLLNPDDAPEDGQQ